MATNMNEIYKYAKVTDFNGLPEGFTASGKIIEPGCEDELIIAFKTKREVITDIGFELSEDACGTARACANVMMELAKDQPVMVAYTLNHEDIAKVVSDDGILDKEHVHCAMMAELALKKAIVDHSEQIKQRMTSC